MFQCQIYCALFYTSFTTTVSFIITQKINLKIHALMEIPEFDEIFMITDCTFLSVALAKKNVSEGIYYCHG